jgi:hypothetical protein
LVRRSECVPYSLGSSPTLPIQSDTRRAYWRVDRSAGLLMAYGCAIRGVSARGDIVDFDRYDIAATKLAVDRQIEHGEVSDAAFNLKLRPDRPDMFEPQWRLRPRQLVLIPRRLPADRRDSGLLIWHITLPRLKRPKSMSLWLRRWNWGELSDHHELGPALHNMPAAHARNGLLASPKNRKSVDPLKHARAALPSTFLLRRSSFF